LQPAYHSKQGTEELQEACSCALCPLRTDLKGPAAIAQQGTFLTNTMTFMHFNFVLKGLPQLMKELIYNLSGAEDVIDETLGFFRANVLFRNFDVRGGADRTLIYLTLYAVQCLVKCEKIEDKSTAVREMKNLATKQFLCPGDPGWPLGGLFPSPKSKAESGTSIARINRSIELKQLSAIFN
jgi:actin related protein 2/3 complex subunit 3